MRQCLNPACLHLNPDSYRFCQQCSDKLLLMERYWAKRILGQGGFGRTFLAVDEFKPSKPPCVIKQFFPRAQGTENLQKAAELFDQEARRLEELGRHPQIPNLLAYFTADNRQYLVQELIDGKTLRQESSDRGNFREDDIWEILHELLTVLQFVHDRRVIHRDIKPENIIRNQTENKLVLVDFGAAKKVSYPAHCAPETIIGSAPYCAPEQAMGKPKFASDLYSLGVTCLHLLTRMSPSELYDENEAKWVWRNDLRGNRVGDELGDILDRLVARQIKARYQSVREVIEDLRCAPTTIISQPPRTNCFQFTTVQVDERGREINRSSRRTESMIEDLGDGMTLELASIPGGTFTMGSPDDEEGRWADESPQHEVNIQPFLMGKYIVTQSQWKRVANFPKILRELDPEPARFKGENRPVERVNWYDAIEFCARLSETTGKRYRLPSEAEWEYACRAGTRTPFYFGPTLTTDLANYRGTDWENHHQIYRGFYGAGPRGIYREKTTPVGYFQIANAFGLYDMHGNVWEWCADPWHQNYGGAPQDGRVWDEIYNENCYQNYAEYLIVLHGDDRRRVTRGGSWNYTPSICRSAYRLNTHPNNGYVSLGFRVVQTED
ncbi:bifunctional serine/threonine-protein kinase/formylglycine-generating enzyme family protein [Lyngbya sp. CCY1209]|uniref:bifunctional serine/threonine-protein kinase/formylglycine-generating enzyme family protein n=1 Tax=Lyngbya sp. CCY1209 TaxID=2886103 RepID=UPI002D208AE6|nr:bifunctional serine/threonine-protein kinase/formylglycine-generating enzyme family protein [Lyngbya sp. CCY1209]MEB3882826.1 bifunctional serine/threonine-protein kinase/formylglycine-generating enzyme family protein [Lyngbya sp. CCY1209]